jgi:hypothetical protein
MINPQQNFSKPSTIKIQTHIEATTQQQPSQQVQLKNAPTLHVSLAQNGSEPITPNKNPQKPSTIKIQTYVEAKTQQPSQQIPTNIVSTLHHSSPTKRKEPIPVVSPPPEFLKTQYH